MSLTATLLFDGELLRIRRVVCRPSHAAPGDVERSDADTIVLPVRGVFAKHLSAHARLLAEPTQALFFAAGRPYRVSHPLGSGDECLVLHFTPEALRDALVDVAGADALADGGLLPHATLAPGALVARELLRVRLLRGAADALEAEETALALLASAVSAARRDERAVTPRRTRPSTRARRRDQVVAVREHLLADPGGDATLGDVARLAHTTPYHLARVFRDAVGVPIHQYRLRIRLARALELLLDTRWSVSRIAFELGFSSHSHFTAAFRAGTGSTPRGLRRRATVAHTREVRRNLTERPATTR